MLNRRTAILAGAAVAAMSAPAFAAPPRKPKMKPNILYIKFDDMDDNNPLSFMPNLRKLAQSGIRFVNSFVDCSSCGPSRASTLTGMSLMRHGLVGDRSPKGGFSTFNQTYGAQALPVQVRTAGYETCTIGRYMTGTSFEDGIPAGWDEAHILCDPTRPFAYYGYSLNENGTLVKFGKKPEEYQTYVLFDRAEAFVEKHHDKPWFLYLCTGAPHGDGYGDVNDAPTPAPEDEQADVGEQPQGGAFNEADVSDKPHATLGDRPLLDPAFSNFVWKSRRRAMLSVDRRIGNLMSALEVSGQLENTYVIIDSDNGYGEGAHRLEEKILVYDADQRVPLIIAGPAIPTTGQELTHLVNNLDTTATIFDLTGATSAYTLDGVSYKRLFNGGEGVAWRKYLLCENSVTQAVRTADDFYAETNTPEFGLEREYYAYASDPLQMRNAVNVPAYADRITLLTKQLGNLRAARKAA